MIHDKNNNKKNVFPLLILYTNISSVFDHINVKTKMPFAEGNDLSTRSSRIIVIENSTQHSQIRAHTQKQKKNTILLIINNVMVK